MSVSTEQKDHLYKYAAYTVDQLLQELQTSLEAGLSLQQVVHRQTTFGRNELQARKVTWWGILWQQCLSPFIYLLMGIAIVTLLLHDTTNAALIGILIVLNIAVGFYQEYKAERSLELLKSYLMSKVSVKREGKEIKISHHEVVPGDVLLLYPGDIIPADVRIVIEENVYVDESLFTGESGPVKKVAIPVNHETQKCIADNFGMSGASIVSGKATAIVVATGMNTALAATMQGMQDSGVVSGFTQELHQFSHTLIYVIGITVAIIFMTHLFIFAQPDLLTMLAFSLALGVSVIPEALPVVATFGFTRGALRLAQQKVLVKRLSAVQDLGSIQVLCTDKTGTLTENKLSLGTVYAPTQTAAQVLQAATLASGLPAHAYAQAKGFDEVLYKNLSAEQQADIATFTVIQQVPFDPSSRRSLVLLVDQEGIRCVLMRGAPEVVLAACGLAAEQDQEIQQWLKQEGSQGARVLAIAYTSVSAETSLADVPPSQLIGLISFYDPLKPTAQYAIRKAHELGVQVKIISGDSLEVCAAIAQKVGLGSSANAIITGSYFEKQPYEMKKKLIETCVAFARVMPEQKYEIIALLREKYRVGYMGDGINDAPALKCADVALAVDDAADIARDAADIILLHSSLRVVVNGIQLGRETFANTLKYMKTTLAAGFGHFYALACASLFLDFLPMMPIQILMLNLLSDFPLIALCTDTVATSEISQPQRYNIKDILAKAAVFGLLIMATDMVVFWFFHGAPAAVLQTAWFISCILTELLFTFCMRSSVAFYKAPMPSWPLLILSGMVGIITFILPYTALGQHYLHFVPLGGSDLIVLILLACGCFVAAELIKQLYTKGFAY